MSTLVISSTSSIALRRLSSTLYWWKGNLSSTLAWQFVKWHIWTWPTIPSVTLIIASRNGIIGKLYIPKIVHMHFIARFAHTRILMGTYLWEPHERSFPQTSVHMWSISMQQFRPHLCLPHVRFLLHLFSHNTSSGRLVNSLQGSSRSIEPQRHRTYNDAIVFSIWAILISKYIPSAIAPYI